MDNNTNPIPVKHHTWLLKSLFKSLLLILLITPTLSSADAATSSAKHLRFGLYSFPPFVEQTDSGIKGHWVDALTKAATKAGYTYEVKVYPPRRLQFMLYQGDIDLSIVVSGYLDLALDKVQYNRRPIFEHETGVASFTPFESQNIEELFNKKIGMIRGYSYGKERNRINKHASKIQIIEGKDHNQLLRLLVANRIDYALVYKKPMLFEKEKVRPDSELYFSTVKPIKFHFLISKKRAGYNDILNDIESAFFH